jgi:hypothetical protein
MVYAYNNKAFDCVRKSRVKMGGAWSGVEIARMGNYAGNKCQAGRQMSGWTEGI